MKTSISSALFWLAAGLAAPAYTDLGNNILQSNGTSADTQAAINAASDGYTVLIPAGSFTWSSGLKIAGKGIRLQGAGAGGLLGHSTTSVSIGTGSKTFTTQSGLELSPGQPVRAFYTADGRNNWMEGTVISYSGNTLVINVSSVGGSGTKAFWTFGVLQSTLITHSAGGSVLVELSEDTSRSVEIVGIRFIEGSAPLGHHLSIDSVNGGKPVLIHDCWFSTAGAMDRSIRTTANRGVIYRCSFDSGFYSGRGDGHGNDDQAIGFKSDHETYSWEQPSKMGMDDIDGLGNFYVEDCYFAGIYLQTMDFDGNSRAVIRYCTFNNSAMSSHGADTGPVGTRHFQIYNNTFVFTDVGTETFGLDYWFFIRGGTGVIADNIMPNMNSSQWGSKLAIKMIVMNLQRSGGPNPCWGAGAAGSQYPAPRQVGMGRVTGMGGQDSITYRGDSEPLYIWNNVGNPVAGVVDYGGGACGSPDSSADYIVHGRDYFNDGTPKPGWQKYTYPHPFRSPSAKPSPPQNVRVSP